MVHYSIRSTIGLLTFRPLLHASLPPFSPLVSKMQLRIRVVVAIVHLPSCHWSRYGFGLDLCNHFCISPARCRLGGYISVARYGVDMHMSV